MTDTEELPSLTGGDGCNEEAPFRFFDLPRELRDWCYDYMIGPTIKLKTMRDREEYDSDSETDDTSKNTVKDRCALELAIRAPPLVDVLRASRELKSEYEQRAVKQTMLIIYDHLQNETFMEFTPGTVNVSHFNWVTRAEYRGAAHCPQDQECVRDVELAKQWMEATVSKLSNLRDLRVYLALHCETADGKSRWPKYSHRDDVQGELRGVTEIDCVTQLHVFRGAQTVYKLEEIPAEDMLYVRWTRRDGWVAPKPTETQVSEDSWWSNDGDGEWIEDDEGERPEDRES